MVVYKDSEHLESTARALNPGFIQRMQTGRPRIRCKMAMSLDGRTAMASGESQWITSADARKDVQRLRAESSAILTGIGTALADDPSLNVRDKAFKVPQRQPDRLILDTFLRTPPTARMLALAGVTRIFTSVQDVSSPQFKAIETQGAQIIEIPRDNGRVSLKQVMEHLAQLEYNEVLLEAGATLSGAMLKAGFIDELIVYMAPHLMGNKARGLFNIPGVDKMKERIELEIKDIVSVGNDFRIIARPLLAE